MLCALTWLVVSKLSKRCLIAQGLKSPLSIYDARVHANPHLYNARVHANPHLPTRVFFGSQSAFVKWPTLGWRGLSARDLMGLAVHTLGETVVGR